MITSHDVLKPLKQAVLASRDVIISGQICGSKLQRVFTFGDGCCVSYKLGWVWSSFVISSKAKRLGEKGAPKNHSAISSQKLADFECRFPYDTYGRDRSPFRPLFGRRSLGQYPAAPCSPGPFVLLLMFSGLQTAPFE